MSAITILYISVGWDDTSFFFLLNMSLLLFLVQGFSSQILKVSG